MSDLGALGCMSDSGDMSRRIIGSSEHLLIRTSYVSRKHAATCDGASDIYACPMMRHAQRAPRAPWSLWGAPPV